MKSEQQAWLARLRSILTTALLPALAPLLLPCAHMLIFSYLWKKNYHVDRKNCECSCWDTIFKGPYEDGVARYKHIYFNSTENTMKIWSITVLAIVALYESFKLIFYLLRKNQLRYRMGFLFFVSLHSNYFAWWVHLNYWNDDFYPQWNHQMFFTLTELISTGLVMWNFDRRKNLDTLSLLIVANIALFHVTASGLDQFVDNVLLAHGRLDQVLRDLALMSTDLLYIFTILYDLRQAAISKGETLFSLIYQRSNVITVIVATMFMYVSVMLLP